MWDLYADRMVVLILYTISKIGVVGIRLGDFISLYIFVMMHHYKTAE